MSTVYLKCKEVHPAGCVAAIEHVLYRQGVTHFEYDVTNEQAKVIYDPLVVTLDQILKKINDIGYLVDVQGIDEKDEW